MRFVHLCYYTFLFHIWEYSTSAAKLWDNTHNGLTSIMAYRFYTTSQKALTGMFSAIESAQSSVYLEMYIFEHDQTGREFLSLLEEKAREGVRVIVILDSIGSFGITTAEIERLKSSGAEVHFFSFWFKRTHRKILIIDDAIVFLGGVNISGRFARWKDLQVRLTGKRIAQSATRSFARVYHQCGGTNPELVSNATPHLLNRTRLWFQEHGAGPKHRSLRRYYEAHIDRALHSIILVTPYFIPHRWLIARLHSAILRGVQVTIIVPKQTDHPLVDRVNAYYLDIFSQLGAHCVQGKIMNHAKVMLIDDREGTIGSHNLDALSFDWNVEASVFFESPGMVKHLGKIIMNWKQDSETYTPQTGHSLWYDIPLRIFLGLFHSIL